MLRPRRIADPVFRTGAASLYLPAFRKLVLAEGISPSSPMLEASRSMIELREQLETGCPGWSRTSTSPLNKRVDYYYPTGQCKKWSAWQELHLRSLRPKRSMLLLHHTRFAPAFWRAPGTWFCGNGDAVPWNMSPVRLADPKGLAPSAFPQTTGCSALELRILDKLVGSVGNAPIRRFRLCFKTPDLQSGSRITSLRIV